ncbi:hypothetical protein K488DRAFT_74965, partial [Vararia minispora EC-137]
LFQEGPRNIIPMQSITLTGVGSTHFKRAVKSVQNIYRFLLSKYPDLLPLEIDVYEGWPTLTFQTKLVTAHSALDKNAEVLSFSDLDPRHIMSKALSSRGAYTANNIVLYQCVGDLDSEEDIVPARSQEVLVGKTVSIQLGIVVVPANHGKAHRMVLKLHAVLIISQEVFEEVLFSASNDEDKEGDEIVSVGVKRKVHAELESIYIIYLLFDPKERRMFLESWIA